MHASLLKVSLVATHTHTHMRKDEAKLLDSGVQNLISYEGCFCSRFVRTN